MIRVFSCSFSIAVILVMSLFQVLGFAQEVKDILRIMPEDDRLALRQLFYRMMNDDHFSYTLFGDKPVSTSGDFTITPFGNLILGMRCGGVFWNSWKVWKKYESYFPISHYLLLEIPSNDNAKSIVFINKKAFLKKVTQHLALFKEILGEKTTAFHLLSKIENNHCFFTLIKQNQMLFGILLGYGVHNSKLFFERYKLAQFLSFKKIPKIPHKIPCASEQFSSIEDEHCYLQSKLRPFGEYSYSTLIIGPLHFMADHEHLETVALQQKYQELRGKISSIYAQGDFLEITLRQLTSSSSASDCWKRGNDRPLH